MFQESAHDARLRRMTKLYSLFMGTADLVFDIGANRGDWTEAFLCLGARVVAVEPQPHCVTRLKQRFGDRDDVIIRGEALGSREGEGILELSNNDTVSSMSSQWIERAKGSGRFEDSQWGRRIVVPVTTLDTLRQAYGHPVFIKIDVEGFEDEVLRGLSIPVSNISFEYTPEYLEPALRSMEHLGRLGPYSYNYSEGDSMVLALGEYVGMDVLIGELESLARLGKAAVSGDIYARLTQ